MTFKGVFANLPTAFDAHGRLDLATLRARIGWLLEQGVHGLSAQLSAGEFTYLSLEERMAQATAVIEAAEGAVPVLIGVSADPLADTLRLARHAQAAGAAAVMVMPKSYFRLNDDEIVALYAAVGEAVSCPIGIYNNPFTTGVDLSAALHGRIAAACPIAVTKDGSGDIGRVSELRAAGSAFAYLCGTEFQSLPSFLLGADGCCNGINSVFPGVIVRLYDCVRQQRLDEADEIFLSLAPLFRFVRTHGVVRTTKAAAEIVGRSYGPHRLPMRALDADAMRQLRDIVEGCELFGLRGAGLH
ncbi:dihydrodipicolinate synthase family protein [Burkholderia sp. 22PA0106]|uniref:dihydrodipicolinate synthase family protein n=1 Tax=Burkholderia sp. 22PA0106 TaxID=3237371 RepID=UPI0039C3B068